MFRKMMKHLTNNMGLKLLSILFSIVLWLVVVNIADPEATKSFSIPVEVINKDVITEMGKVPSIVGDSDIAVFYISGPRSQVDSMSSDDFSATADLSQMDLSQEGETKLVPIEVTAKRHNARIEIVRRSVNIQVTLEDRLEKKFVISAEAAGTPADGYAIGNVEVTPNLLKVSGPASVVSKISRVGVSINVDGVSSDVSDNVIPILYNENDSVISSDLLEINQTTVTIRAEIWAARNVPVRCQVNGKPAAGYELRGVECAPETVLVKGKAAVLNAISVITIPADVVNIEGAVEDLETTVDIKPYLEELHVSLVDDNTGQIAVTAIIEQKQTKTFEFPTGNIRITGLNSQYELNFGVDLVSLNVRALEENLQTLTSENIEALLDVTDLQPGTYTRQLSISFPGDKYELMGLANIQFTIIDKNQQLEEEDGRPMNPNERPDANTDDGAEDDAGDTLEDNDSAE